MAYETILTEIPAPGVGLVRFNRPDKLNVLNETMLGELFDALEAFDADESVGCLVVTGSEKAFAAGADIKRMAEADMPAMLRDDFTDWRRLDRLAKPVIAAVSGWALGGGCEIALACDLVVASETARFGQPEIGIGIMPGAGGTQRLARVLGKALTMELCLTDRKLTAAEALHYGLVNRVVGTEAYLDEAVQMAAIIAGQPRVSVRLIKDAVNQAFEVGLGAGLAHEKRNFYLTFATDDKTEGMSAFIEKRSPEWRHQ